MTLIKCGFCGANIDISAEVCPYCGMKKSQFQTHREDMKKLQADYIKTKETAVKENVSFSKKAAYAVMLSFILVACLVVFIALTQNYQIHKAFAKRSNEKNAEKHISILKDLEENEEYELFTSYVLENDLSYNIRDEKSVFYEYKALNRLADHYATCMTKLYDIPLLGTEGDYYEDGYSEGNIKYIAENYETFEKVYEQFLEESDPEYKYPTYSKEALSKEHLESMEKMRNRLRETYSYLLRLEGDEQEQFFDGTPAQRLLITETKIRQIEEERREKYGQSK